MTAVRRPTVGGLAGGVGATTVARALHGVEVGPVGGAGRLPDVVVGRGTVSGLALAGRIRPAGRATPVLVVTEPGAQEGERVAGRLRGLDHSWSGPVTLPWVPGWTDAVDPHAEAAELLARHDLPEPLPGYVAALHQVVGLLTASGRLDREEEDDEPNPAAVLRPVRGIRLGTAW